MRLSVHRFAQIESVDIDFGAPGDLTILIGQQATGKSLALQWLKLLTDTRIIHKDWDSFGANWKIAREPLRPLDLFFGEGLGQGYGERTSIKLDGKAMSLGSLFSRTKGPAANQRLAEATYFIPAHRALLLADGWPKNFQQHVPGTPYVARAQSERLARWLGDADVTIFPIDRKLPRSLRGLFNDSIFHRAHLEADRGSPQARLVLKPQSTTSIPYMAWTAGQREFVPLLVALYELMPSGAVPRLDKFETVVLEEPELGLHPKALFAVGVAILHLMALGYRVAISSHSPLLVDFAWALNRLRVAARHDKATTRDFLSTFGLASNAHNKQLADRLRQAVARTYYLTYTEEGTVRSKDISALRTYANDPDQSSWGELLKYSTRLAEVVGQLDIDFSALDPSELST